MFWSYVPFIASIPRQVLLPMPPAPPPPTRRTAVAGAQAAQKAAHVLGDARRSGQAAAEKALGSLMRAGGLAKKPKEAVLRDAARDEAAREEEELQAVLALSLKEFEAQQAKSVEESPAKQESSPGVKRLPVRRSVRVNKLVLDVCPNLLRWTVTV